MAAACLALAAACGGDEEAERDGGDAADDATVDDDGAGGEGEYADRMVAFVTAIAERGRESDSGFLVFPQNGAALLDRDDYREVVDGIGQEDFSYGYDADGERTPADVSEALAVHLDRLVEDGKTVLIADYPFTDEEEPDTDEAARARVADAYAAAEARGYVPYCTVRSLARVVVHEDQPRGWLYALQSEGGREEFLSAVEDAGFERLVTDYSYDGTDEGAWTEDEVARLRDAVGGGPVLAYFSIGEAEDYRWYWDESWNDAPPAWLGPENPDWPGNYKVRYWDPDWQAVVFEYLDRVVAAGFDGVYLDIIDAYEYWEDVEG